MWAISRPGISQNRRPRGEAEGVLQTHLAEKALGNAGCRNTHGGNGGAGHLHGITGDFIEGIYGALSPTAIKGMLSRLYLDVLLPFHKQGLAVMFVQQGLGTAATGHLRRIGTPRYCREALVAGTEKADSDLVPQIGIGFERCPLPAIGRGDSGYRPLPGGVTGCLDTTVLQVGPFPDVRHHE